MTGDSLDVLLQKAKSMLKALHVDLTQVDAHCARVGASCGGAHLVCRDFAVLHLVSRDESP